MNAKNGKIDGFRYSFKYWLPVVVLLGIIFWLSGGNFTDGRTSEFFFPKIKTLFPGLSEDGVTFVHEAIRALAHIVEFFLLGLFLSFAVFRSPLRLSRVEKIVLIMVLLFVFALGDEFRQTMVALRHASLVDVGLDLLGGMMAPIIVQRSKFYVQG